MKGALVRQQFSGPEGFLTGIQRFMSEIQRSELELVCHHWIERINGCWIMMETSSMRKPSMITIRSSVAPIGLGPLLIDLPIDPWNVMRTV
jgi:hypothetical protein